MSIAPRWKSGTKHPVTGDAVGGRFMRVADRKLFLPDGRLKPTPKKAAKRAPAPKVQDVPDVKVRPLHLRPPAHQMARAADAFKRIVAGCVPARKRGIVATLGELDNGSLFELQGTLVVLSYDLCSMHLSAVEGTIMFALSRALRTPLSQLFPGAVIRTKNGIYSHGPGSPL